MSLPKEPRQKMINIMYLVLTALLALNVSSEILNAFRTVRRSLENSNVTVNQSTAIIMKSLEDKSNDAVTTERATPWFQKAQKVVATSDAIYKYIDGLKNDIITKAGGKPGDPSVTFKEDNLDIVTKMFVQGKEGDKLKQKLEQFQKDILGIDPEIDSAFKNHSISTFPTLPARMVKPRPGIWLTLTWYRPLPV